MEFQMDTVIVVSVRATIGRLARPIEEFGGAILQMQRVQLTHSPWGKFLVPDCQEPLTLIEVEVPDYQVFKARLAMDYGEARVFEPKVSRLINTCLFGAHHGSDEDELVKLLTEGQLVS